MSVLVFAESPEGACKKVAFEAVTYGKLTADIMGTSCFAMTIGSPSNAEDLGKFGAGNIFNVPLDGLTFLDGHIYSDIIASVAKEIGADTVILSHTSTGKTIAGMIAIKLNAGLVSAVNSLPSVDSGFSVKRMVFSGKAIATYDISSEIKVLSVMVNSFPPVESGSAGTVDNHPVEHNATPLVLKEVRKQSGSVPLPEAELVVSGGRGFKGPENWGILEELAKELGAGTACSRPVADSGWRPHHEHVGQTGVAISPNLYIAIGISGAIQHLGGVNNSKTIVVINKDPEAPFFKAADYGVVADLFEVVPKLTEALRRYKSA